MISSKDVSVVVQGPVDFSTIETVLQSIRNCLPEAEIILSTWEGVDYSSIPKNLYDILVTSEDPGGFALYRTKKTLHNIDRQIRSTFEGIKKASRQCTLKTRTDIVLTHNRFLTYFERYPQYEDEYKVVRSRMLVNASGSPDPIWSYPLHPGDFFLFGYTSDLYRYFSAGLYPESYKDYEHNLDSSLAKCCKQIDGELLRNRYPAEMYMFMQFIKPQFPDIEKIALYSFSASSISLSYHLLVNNFVMLSEQQSGIKSLKYPNFERKHYLRVFTNLKWQKFYQRFCDANYTIEPQEVKREMSLFNWILPMIANSEFNLKLYYLLGLIKYLFMLQHKCNKVFRGILKNIPNYSFEAHEFSFIASFVHYILGLMLQDKQLMQEIKPFLNIPSR
jgi:hypothetical protein